MKTAKMLTICVLALGLIVCQARVSEAAPMGTAFTYQGHLYDANHVADGLYDFQFKLFNSASDGNQVGSDVNVPDVDVIDALFTVELDFGSSVFNGDARWLEIGVRAGELSDPCAYTPLSPRQEVTPTPYALQTRGIFVDESGNVGIGTTSPSTPLEVVSSTANAVIRCGRGDQDGQLSIAQDSHNNWGLDAGSFGILATGSSQHIGFRATSSGDAQLVLRTSGNVGVGNTNPSYKLDVSGDIRATGTIYGTADNADKVDGYHAGNSSGQVAVSNGTLCANLNSDKLDGQHGSYYQNASNLNAGTISEARLPQNAIDGSEIEDNSITAADIATDGVGSAEIAAGAVGSSEIASGTTVTGSPDNAPVFTGHGTGSAYGLKGLAENNYGVWGVSEGSGSWSWGVLGQATGSGVGGWFSSQSGYGLIVEKGNVGIGTKSPTEKLDVDGTARLRGISAAAGATYVHVDGNGKLWKIASSKRYKTNIRDLEDNSDAVLRLRPVRFEWKTTGQEDIGLVAEDVQEVLTDLVIYDEEGRPEAVKYDRVALYLLGVVKNQQDKIAALEERIVALENTKNEHILAGTKEVQQ